MYTLKKIAIILSGCGNRDGSELRETLSLLLALDRRGMQVQCFAPDITFSVHSYLDPAGTETGEKRQLLAEAARVARDGILNLAEYRAADYDALALPGGMGAARNLSTFATDGVQMTVLPDVERAILETYDAHKPICAMCIAPIVLAKVLGNHGITLTLGQPCAASTAAEQMGAHHQCCQATDVAVDQEHRIVTTPAYMVGTRISEIFDGADNMVAELAKML